MHNSKTLLIFLLVFLLGGPVYSQDDLSGDIDSLESDMTTTDEVKRDAEGMELFEQKQNIDAALAKKGIKKEDLKGMMEELQKANPEGFRKMQAGELSPEESSAMMKEAFSKLPPETVAKIMGGTSDMIGNKLKAVSTGLNAVPYETALANIRKQVDASKAAPFFKMIPRSHEFLTHFLRDEKASAKFFGIVKNRDRLITFAAINIFLMFVSWRIKARRKKMKLSAAESFSKGLFHFIIFTFIKLGVIWYFFSLEIKPIWAVIQKTYA